MLSKQLVKAETFIGANLEEAAGGQSLKDFISKISIAYKEARQAHYWIRLIRDAVLTNDKQAENLLADCEELLKIIGSIQKTMKENEHKEGRE